MGRRLRLIIDREGRLIRQSVIDFGSYPLPPAMRRPKAIAVATEDSEAKRWPDGREPRGKG
jgi:hypothetical protein